MRQRRATTGVMAALVLLTGACGGGDSTPAAPTVSAGAVDLTITALDPKYSYDKESYAAKAGVITIELVNGGKENHNLLVQGVPSKTFKLTASRPGDRKVAAVQLSAGTYTVYCDIAGHRKAGMEARLVVS